MHYTYYPKGVCSQQMDIETDGSTIKSLKVTGGCNGNLQGIARLVEGMDIVMSQHNGSLEFCVYQLFGLIHLCLANSEFRQIHMVELQLIALHGIIATTLHISQDRSHRLVQL